jgi:NDP-sugar pyrophosphorylase family protein
MTGLPFMSLSAFFLCAGYGQRLRPLTDRVAKPALPFLGESAFEINVHAVAALNPEQWLANAHHLPQQIQALGTALGVRVLVEEEILGTGGCLAHAAPILDLTGHFLVHNADLIHDIDLAALYRRHLDSGAMATLAGVRRAGAVNTLSAGPGGELLGVHGFQDFDATAEASRMTFTGIAFYRREFLSFVPLGPSDIKPWWIAALDARGGIRVEDCTGSAWHDFGTPQGLWEAARHRMESTGAFSHRYPAATGTAPFVANEAGLAGLPAGLENVLIYEDPRAPLISPLRNRIVGRDFSWPIRA